MSNELQDARDAREAHLAALRLAKIDAVQEIIQRNVQLAAHVRFIKEMAIENAPGCVDEIIKVCDEALRG